MVNLELIEEYSTYLEKKKQEGKTIIAFLAHDNIPEELIYAAGCIPLRLIFSGNEELMNESSNYLPPSTCSFAQSCIGLFALKPYPFLESIDYFIVSNHCVSDICASEIISKYFFIPRINFYCAYTQDENAAAYYKLELMDLKTELDKIKGSEIKDEEIIEVIKKYNTLKEKLARVNDLNIKSSIKLEINQKAMLYGIDYLEELERILGNSSKLEAEMTNHTKDLLLTGCSIFINDYIVELIEESGGNIVVFDSWVGNTYYSQTIDEESLETFKNPLDLFVHRYKTNTFGDHAVPQFLENKLDRIKRFITQHAKKTGKKLGVINHIIKFCDHISLFQTELKAKLQEQGIQVLNLERDYSKSMRGQLSTRIEAFLEMM